MEKAELPHVYKVKAGERIEDYICDKDGYIWFDEAGLLGASMVYDTLEQANVDNLYHEVVGIVELDTFNPTSLIREKALAKLTEEEKKVLGLI
jgi:hypothetical protein